jgi:colicin import membrane protein
MKKTASLCAILLFAITISTLNAQTKKEIAQKLQVLEKENLEFKSEINSIKQSFIDLQREINQTKVENESLKIQISELKKSAAIQPYGIVDNKEQTSPNQTPGRCKAITAKGTQCSRTAEPSSDYCWQHKSTYEPNSQPSNLISPIKSSGSSGGSTGSGRVIHTGPRGGKYYINSKGNKTYIKR